MRSKAEAEAIAKKALTDPSLNTFNTPHRKPRYVLDVRWGFCLRDGEMDNR